MSQQNKKKPQTQANTREDLQQQEKLQAVVILDSYSNNFLPFSSHRAECLLPFPGGKTLLDNNMEYLIENGVEEIILFCTKHHQQINKHIEERKWRRLVEIHFFYNFQCKSLGDAMREIDAKGVIRSNFVLLTATSIISNLKLKDHLETHKQTCKMDKNAVMTIMCLKSENDLQAHSLNEHSAQYNPLIIHNSNNRVVHYEYLIQTESSNSTDKKGKYISMPSEFIQVAYKSNRTSSIQEAVDKANAKLKLSNEMSTLNATSGFQGDAFETLNQLKAIQQRTDLLETHIYLCNPYVLHGFTDNFDFVTMSDFVRGLLNEEEVSGYTVYIDMLKLYFGSHFSMIYDLNSYYYETMRILQRTDLILDFGTFCNYRKLLDKINVHISKTGTHLASNSSCKRNVFIEANCKLGENTHLVNCYIGANCVIGKNVKLSNSIIWSNTRIGDGTQLNAAFLGSNVRVGSSCRFVENVLFSDDCHVKNNSNLNERGVFVRRESTKEQKLRDHQPMSPTDSLNNVNEDNYVKLILGNNIYLNEDDDEDEDEFDLEGHEFMNNEEDDEDNQSVNSDAKHFGDTSLNQHFYVWKFKVGKEQLSAVPTREQPQIEYMDDEDLHEKDTYSSTSSSDYESSEEEEEEDGSDGENKVDTKTTTANSQKPITDDKLHEDTDIFYSEVIDLLKRGLKDNFDQNNVILEINSSKHANNIQIDDVSYYVAKALFHLPFVLNDTSQQPLDYLSLIKGYAEKFGVVLKNYFTKTKQSQIMFLNCLQDFFVENKALISDALYVKVLHALYNDYEFLSENVIVEWYTNQKSVLQLKDQQTSTSDAKQQALIQSIENKKHLIHKLQQFIDWLEESEEDEDDEEEEEDD
jgi:translation initiation factor eIF-2B subunit epsilon